MDIKKSASGGAKPLKALAYWILPYIKDSVQADILLAKSVSRFARNTVDNLTTIRKLKGNGIECYFEKEYIWTFDGKGELLITIMNSLAQEESRSISENCTWGAAQADSRRQGQRGLQPVPRL